jgi:hypothetical protein
MKQGSAYKEYNVVDAFGNPSLLSMTHYSLFNTSCCRTELLFGFVCVPLVLLEVQL